jgi:signal transduction histidine kinase
MSRVAYWAALAAAFVVAVIAGYTTLAEQLDNDVYDFLFRTHGEPPVELSSVIYGIDEQTLQRGGGQPNLRKILTEGLERLVPYQPGVVVVDLILADAIDPATDERLAKAMAQLPKVVLASSLLRDGSWEGPLDRFPRFAVAHAHADPDPYDNVVRQIPLEKASGSDHRWALSFEGLRAMEPRLEIEQSPNALQIGGVHLPSRQSEGRPMLVRYQPLSDPIPQIGFAELQAKPSLGESMRGKAVFVGLTAQSASQDRHATPFSFGQTMVGVEVHANAYETLKRRAFIRRANNSEIALTALALVGIIGLMFVQLTGWRPYVLTGAALALSHVIPFMAFSQGVVFPYTTLFAAVWLGAVTAATFQSAATRRSLRQSERDRSRYQDAIRFVTHEMRSPLTAIQGSSELMGRYKLPEEKRADIARMINAESKRLGRMIQTFLDVERLSEGEMQLKREPFDLDHLISVCMERAQPLADRKNIQMHPPSPTGISVSGDLELMEYALYNLINNAIKYSPPDTEVRVAVLVDKSTVRLSVRDQGMGMDAAEVSQVFKRFYRTERAQRSGEAGTGVGLSIVDQIVTRHGGKMEVESAPGVGSCFSILLPLAGR